MATKQYTEQWLRKRGTFTTVLRTPFLAKRDDMYAITVEEHEECEKERLAFNAARARKRIVEISGEVPNDEPAKPQGALLPPGISHEDAAVSEEQAPAAPLNIDTMDLEGLKALAAELKIAVPTSMKEATLRKQIKQVQKADEQAVRKEE